MDKKTAFKVLVENSYFLSEDEKTDLLSNIDVIPEADRDAIGKFLAFETKSSLEDYTRLTSRIKEIHKAINISKSA